jgi:hypothetical protein
VLEFKSPLFYLVLTSKCKRRHAGKGLSLSEKVKTLYLVRKEKKNPHVKIVKIASADGVVQVVEHLPSKCKALSSACLACVRPWAQSSVK